MKLRISFLIAANFLVIYSFSQSNLIPNPGFEHFSQCPPSWGKFNNFVDDWRSYNYEASYINKCNSILIDDFIYEPLNQEGLVSLEVYHTRIRVTWKYIQVKLKQPLKPNTSYYLEFFHHVSSNSVQIRNYQAFFFR